MSPASVLGEAGGQDGLLGQMAHHLHEMSQPLTALLCRLEIEQMEREGVPLASIDRTLAECVRECERLNERVSAMRARVRTALNEARNQERNTEHNEATEIQA